MRMLLLLVVLVLVGCNEPTISVKKRDDIQKEITRVVKQLPESSREEFKTAVDVYLFYKLKGTTSKDENAGAKIIDGKTTSQIIDEYNAIPAELRLSLAQEWKAIMERAEEFRKKKAH